MIIFLITLFALLAVGTPIFISLGLGALSLWINNTGNINFIPLFQKMLTGMDNFTLMAIPFFMLAGELMNSGGLSKRLVSFSQKAIGWIPGGLGFATVLACTMIAAILGSAAASAAMIGMVMIPEMTQRGYDKTYAASLVASAGSLGPIIPPSIPLIIYGVIAQQSVVQLFAAGYIPGLMIGGLFMVYNYVYSVRHDYPAEDRPTVKEFLISLKRASLTLMLPIIIMGGILGGIFTPTEAGVVAVVYAFVVATVIYREVTLQELRGAFIRASKSSAMVLVVIAMASYLSWVLTMQRIPQAATSLVLSQTADPITFLLVVNLIVIVLGMFLDAASALTVIVPVLLPAALALKIDPVLFGVMLTVNLSIGVLTPPVGLNLYVVSGIAKIGILKVSRGVLPFILAICLVLMLMCFAPGLFLLFR